MSTVTSMIRDVGTCRQELDDLGPELKIQHDAANHQKMPLIRRKEARSHFVRFHADGVVSGKQEICTSASRPTKCFVVPEHAGGLGEAKILEPDDQMRPRLHTTGAPVSQTRPPSNKDGMYAQIGWDRSCPRIAMEANSNLTVHAKPPAKIPCHGHICTMRIERGTGHVDPVELVADRQLPI